MPRRPSQSHYEQMVKRAERKTERIFDRMAEGKISVDSAFDSFLEYIEQRHTAAAIMGRRRGGDYSPRSVTDEDFGRTIAGEQSKFLAKFREQVHAGRYGVHTDLDRAGIRRRANMYLQRLRGTANEAFAATVPEGESVFWNTTANESCNDCLRYESESPFTPDTLETYPGAGATACITSCLCYLSNASGIDGFKAVS